MSDLVNTIVVDSAIKIYTHYRSHTLQESLTPSGFQYDKARWISPSFHNKNFVLPTNWDPSTEGLEDSLFRSGIDKGEDLRIREIERVPGSYTNWKIGVNSGYFYFNKNKEFLFSDKCVALRPSGDPVTLVASEILSLILPFAPLTGYPIHSYIFERDLMTGDVSIETDFSPMQKMSGIISLGTEKETEEEDFTKENSDFIITENLHPLKKEFVGPFRISEEEGYKNNIQVHFGYVTDPTRVLTSLSDELEDGGVWLFNLDTEKDIVVVEYPEGLRERNDIVEFSRYDLFLSEKDTTAELNLLGDYFFDDTNRILYLVIPILTSETLISYDLGNAKIEIFNDHIIYFNGQYIEKVEVSLGTSNAVANQVFFLQRFPYIDNTTLDILDLTSSVVTVNDEVWIRKPSLEDIGVGNFYVLDSQNGKVFFGDGTDGNIPAKDAEIEFTGYLTPVVFYEPSYHISGEIIFSDKRQNINPLLHPHRGNFIVLSDAANNPANIYLYLYRADSLPGEEFNTALTHLDTDIYLVAKVTDIAGRPVEGAVVNFSILNEVGLLVPYSAITDLTGRAYVRYNPPFLLEDYAISVYYYAPGTTTDETPAELYVDPEAGPLYPFDTTTTERDTLVFASDGIDEDASLADIYLFNISGSDPLLPYDAITRVGGKPVVWYRNTGTEENPNNQLITPLTLTKVSGQWRMVFPVSIPSSYSEDLVGGESELITSLHKAVIVSPLKAQFVATTIDMYNSTITSNLVTAKVELDAIAKGVWTLPNIATGNWDGSAISTATYIEIQGS